ncbi:competence type IV pilus minor pilin ComGD [Bacillus sp. 03113]|uniref:competence type IV pilus minor pilin ComGD n=1 Tax=Bacillus sp. 03113 TaxID=2578211 RepID=UPI00215CC8BF|nr:competence type IV pilus minor pilin ComGD [Bacillus sp. 03113]
MKNQHGFTMMEMLFVFSIFLILSTTTAIILKPQALFLEKQRFFSQLTSDLFYAQQYAISHQQIVTVHIIPNEHRYLINERGRGVLLIERNYSEKVYVYQGSLNLNFEFEANGNVNKFGAFFVQIGKNRYKFTIQIGRGRFYVTKE